MSVHALGALRDLDRGPGQALLRATVALGFSEPVARAGLLAEFDAWDEGPWPAPPYAAPDPPPASTALDAAGVAGAHRRPETVLVIAARTLPASTLRQVALARALGAKVLLKPAGGQAAVAAAIAAADPSVHVRGFASTDVNALDEAISDADSVVALGSDATIASVRDRVPPGVAFWGLGHALSVAWLERLTPADSQGLAHDLCAWDQAGCLSPQVAWVPGDPRDALQAIADAVRDLERSLPMPVGPELVAARRGARTLGEMAGAVLETSSALLIALDDPTFRPTPAARTLWLLPLEGAEPSALGRHLCTVGVSVSAADGPRPRGLADAVRTCPIGQMQRPPLSWLQSSEPAP